MDANTPQGPSPIEVPGIQTRSSGISGQTRLLIFGGVIVVAIILSLMHPADKAMLANRSLLRPGAAGALVFSNSDVNLTFPVPAGWVFSREQKTDDARVRNAADSCRILVMRSSSDVTPASFQEGMAAKMTNDGSRITPLPSMPIDGRQAAHMRADLSSGSVEQIYSVHSGSSMYTLVLVALPDCNEDLSATVLGFQLAK